MADHSDQIEADVARVTKLAQKLIRKCYEVAEKEGYDNFRFDSIGIVSVVAWSDEDKDELEDNAAIFESKKHHVATGILVDLLAGRLQETQWTNSDDY